METTARNLVTRDDVISLTTVPNFPDSLHRKSLPVIDYCLFAAMLAFSALIGVYFAFFAKKKQNTTSEYLMGGKSMGVIPVALSLISRGHFAGNAFGNILVWYAVLRDSFRFGWRQLCQRDFVRAGLVSVAAQFFLRVTGLNVHMITPLLCIVCIFYTSLGGLKAVVWTDVLQTTIMFGAVVIVVGLGTVFVGGFGVVWERSEASGRLELFNFDLNPTTRHTFWNTAFVSVFAWGTDFSVNQSMVQRFLAMSSLHNVKILVVLFTIGISFLTGVSFYAGLLIYAYYHDCDLVLSKAVRAADQVLPYFVMDVTESIPGLHGLFMAGVFSAALSSMSTGLNSMSGVIYEDFIRPFRKVPMSEEQASFLMKIICVIIGVFCFCMVFAVENMGAANQLNESMAGVTNGPLLAVFVLGMFFPWTNAKGTLIGGLAGLVTMGYVCFGTQVAMSNGEITFEKKPATVEGCSFLSNESFVAAESLGAESILSSTQVPPATGDGVFPLFLISYTLYPLMGLIISVVVGLAVSALTGKTDPSDVHINLLTPVVRRLFADRCKGGDELIKRRKRSDYPSENEGKDSFSLLIKSNKGEAVKMEGDTPAYN
ncbi:hypothetical protein J437_LFUL007581 [Ladona fulva]|uniref:Sodium/solute symporter n=1 Tax=Ladona fulva TaxID=123851 RepID=A0A8K0P0K3_LADFU|nr:hypothetical protein J437_LFUL007581 [Ladona fulva]